ncbi:unnamed protein product [Closterium sp. NIES-65]|nr:unnamed protein product [Closterium sp. NIES-65]
MAAHWPAALILLLAIVSADVTTSAPVANSAIFDVSPAIQPAAVPAVRDAALTAANIGRKGGSGIAGISAAAAGGNGGAVFVERSNAAWPFAWGRNASDGSGESYDAGDDTRDVISEFGAMACSAAGLLRFERAGSARTAALGFADQAYFSNESAAAASAANAPTNGDAAGSGKSGGYTEPKDHRTELRWDVYSISGLILTACCALLANAAGIGGGPFYMPLFNSFLGFTANAATGLSHTMVASSGVASTFYGLIQSSPADPSQPLIDLRLALTFTPALLLGVSCGVLLNPLLPPWLQTSLLAVLLGYVARETGIKASKAWEKETQAATARPNQQQQHPSTASASSINTPLLSQSAAAAAPAPSSSAPSSSVPAHAPSKRRWLDPSSGSGRLTDFVAHTAAQLLPLVGLGVLWVAMMALERGLAGTTRCSRPFFLYWAAQTLLCFAATAAMVAYQVRAASTNPDAEGASALSRVLMAGQAEEDGAGDDEVLEARRKRAARKIFKVVGVMVVAGVMAGVLGIGGAPLFNPFMLTLGIPPQVPPRDVSPDHSINVRDDGAIRKCINVSDDGTMPLHQPSCAADPTPSHYPLPLTTPSLSLPPPSFQITASTSVMMVLFGSSSVSLSFLFLHRLNLAYAAIFAPTAFIASLLGVTIVGRIVKSTGRASIIIFILTAIIAVGTTLTVVLGAPRIFDDVMHGRNLWFHSLCPAKKCL